MINIEVQKTNSNIIKKSILDTSYNELTLSHSLVISDACDLIV